MQHNNHTNSPFGRSDEILYPLPSLFLPLKRVVTIRFTPIFTAKKCQTRTKLSLSIKEESRNIVTSSTRCRRQPQRKERERVVGRFVSLMDSLRKDRGHLNSWVLSYRSVYRLNFVIYVYTVHISHSY